MFGVSFPETLDPLNRLAKVHLNRSKPRDMANDWTSRADDQLPDPPF